jgi:hypothetical protein
MIGLNNHDFDIVNHSGFNQLVTAWSIFDIPQGGTTFFRWFWSFSIAKNSKSEFLHIQLLWDRFFSLGNSIPSPFAPQIFVPWLTMGATT